MKVVVVLFMIWSHGYAKNVLGSQDLLKILPGQDITSGGVNAARSVSHNCKDEYFCIYMPDCTLAKSKKLCPNYCNACPGLECDKAAGTVLPNACHVKPNSKPWMVKLFEWKKYYCGGTLISKRVVLTAGHCICEYDCSSAAIQALNGDYVTVGEHDTGELESGDQKIKIEKVVIHTKWTGNISNAFDVALIFLEKDAKLSKDVQIASLPQKDEKCPPGNVLTIAGWGREPFGLGHFHILWAYMQECLDISGCNRFTNLRNDGPILCVLSEFGKPSLDGELGGQLTYTDKDGKTTVFGVISGPGGSTDGKLTAAFSRISYPGILNWIKSTMESAAANDN